MAEFLAKLAFYPVQRNTFLAPGHIVPGDLGVVEGSSLTNVLITRPYFQEAAFEVVHHQDGYHTHILWVIPIHTSERLFAVEHGHRALENAFADNEVDTSDLYREAVV